MRAVVDRVHAAATPSPLDEAVSRFYSLRGFRPAWMDANGRRAAVALLEQVHRSHRHGLCPTLYPALSLQIRLEHPAGDPARLDADLTAGFVRFALHLSRGRDADLDASSSNRPIDVAAVLAEVQRAADVPRAIERLQPVHQEYWALGRGLERYLAIAAGGGWPTIPADDFVRQQTPRGLRLLAERLAVSGDLAMPVADALADRMVLEEAVRRFQARHGLAVDGVVGARTLAALNVPAEQRVSQIELNMDRWRRLPDGLGTSHVRVNIPDFGLELRDGDRVMAAMPVVVGARDQQTPVFSDQIEYLVFRPYWNVPDSIAREELMPKIKANPAVLQKQRLQIVDGWGPDARPVEVSSIDWEGETFGYRLRQLPGPQSSLGLVKFMFPNPYAVYLHDTPADQLFARPSRAYSHGCVRVADPAALAESLLGPAWTAERIREAMSGEAPQVARLPQPVPVHLLYFTAFAGEDGATHFREDIYERDGQAMQRDACRRVES